MTGQGAVKIHTVKREWIPAHVGNVPERHSSCPAKVKKAAWTAMSAAFKLNGNKDISPCVSAMLSCIAHPNEVGDTISKMSALTFVQV